MAFFYVHYVLIYQTVTSLTYVFVPLDFRPLVQLNFLGMGKFPFSRQLPNVIPGKPGKLSTEPGTQRMNRGF
ncbi:hypothetical protein ED741_15535 [Escherichia coli]|nr:hypothetical protein [Escherichia coli]